jgi:hypothetical protein
LSRPIPHRSTLGCRPSSASNNLPELGEDQSPRRQGKLSKSQLGAKHVGLLHELIPSATAIALLVNPANPTQADEQTKLTELGRRCRQAIYLGEY